SLSVAVGLGVVLGVTAARHVNRPADGAIAVLVLLSYATPTFWIGLMLIVLFSVKLGWLPTGGMMTIGTGLSGFGRALDVAHHLLLACAALFLFLRSLHPPPHARLHARGVGAGLRPHRPREGHRRGAGALWPRPPQRAPAAPHHGRRAGGLAPRRLRSRRERL